jgi:putative oxidoreductase
MSDMWKEFRTQLARSGRSAPRSCKLESWAALPLRLIVGYGFMEHGYAKIVKGPEHFVAILHAIGVPAPELMSWATILVELIGGLAVLFGAFVPWVSVPMAVVLLVATFTVHLPYGFSSIKIQTVTPAGAQFGQPGYETDLLYLACLAALVVGGSGRFAVDGLRARLRRAGTASFNRDTKIKS